MDRRDVLAEGVLSTKELLGRYLRGFDDGNHTAVAPGLPNHVAWSLGHLALTMHRVAERLDGKALPSGDFVPGGGPGAFDAERVAYGSAPVAVPAAYPGMARCVAIYGSACDRLAAAVRGASDEALDAKVKWGAGETTVWLLVLRMVFHNGTHTGQIADLRRALGFGSIFA